MPAPILFLLNCLRGKYSQGKVAPGEITAEPYTVSQHIQMSANINEGIHVILIKRHKMSMMIIYLVGNAFTNLKQEYMA